MTIRKDIILASASPRRREMFEEQGVPVEIVPADIDEDLPFAMSPEGAVMYLALAKADRVAEDHQGLIIAADTIVVYDGEIMGKPVDEEDAFRMLSLLRGNVHQVITGVCLVDSREEPRRKECLWDVTDVYFKDYSDEELRRYVETDEPYDKAGGYAIQMTFGKYIDHIDGDRDNVIGFPMHRIRKYLETNEAGTDPADGDKE